MKRKKVEFIGLNWITGRKTYLTSKEKSVLEKQKIDLVKILLYLFGISILLYLLLWVFSLK
jgi:hypothetical protein